MHCKYCENTQIIEKTQKTFSLKFCAACNRLLKIDYLAPDQDLGKYKPAIGKYSEREQNMTLDEIPLVELDSYLAYIENLGNTASKSLRELGAIIDRYLHLPEISRELERELEGIEG